MNMDAIRIKRDSTDKRKAWLINSDVEQRLAIEPYEVEHEEELFYKLYSKEIDLWDADTLTDGEYPIALFKKVDVAAPLVDRDRPVFVSKAKACYRFIDDDAQ